MVGYTGGTRFVASVSLNRLNWLNTRNKPVKLAKDFGTMRRLRETDFSCDAVTGAKLLIGKWLCRRLDDGTVLRGKIVETEAYCGESDSACHAHRGKTQRNAPMYEGGGIAYIYLCYGMHNLLNVVTGAVGNPQAVLIRGVEDHVGPGKLTKFLQIDRSLNREPFAHSERLWLEDDGNRYRYLATSRIGISYATLRDQARKWRFVLVEGKERKPYKAIGRNF